MDPYYVISDARGRGVIPQLIQIARDINESLFQHIVDMVDEGLEKVVILGLSFKKDVKSFETSHTLKLVRLLAEKGYDVTVHDPFLDGTAFQFKTDPDLYHAMRNSDCVILSTAHSQYERLNLNKIKKIMRGDLIVDVRGMFNPKEVLASGLRYKGIGRIL